MELLSHLVMKKDASFLARYTGLYKLLCKLKNNFAYLYGMHGVAQLVEALRFKPESRGFDPPWCHWNFSLRIPPAALWS